MDENAQATELLQTARKVAGKMSRDPEVLSIAGMALLKAIRTFEPARNVPIKLWVARCVRIDVWHYWRKVKVRKVVELKDGDWWDRAVAMPVELPDFELDPADWRLLTEKHILKWPNDVIAREHDTTIHYVRKMLKAAEERFRQAVALSTS